MLQIKKENVKPKRVELLNHIFQGHGIWEILYKRIEFRGEKNPSILYNIQLESFNSLLEVRKALAKTTPSFISFYSTPTTPLSVPPTPR